MRMALVIFPIKLELVFKNQLCTKLFAKKYSSVKYRYLELQGDLDQTSRYSRAGLRDIQNCIPISIFFELPLSSVSNADILIVIIFFSSYLTHKFSALDLI